MSKPEEKKISRRTYLQVAGGTIAGLVVGGAAGYLAKPTVTAPVGTATVTAPVGTAIVTQSVTASAALPFQGITVTNLQESGPPADSAKGLAPMIKQQLGITLNVIEYPYETYYSKVEQELESGSEGYDIMWMDTVEMPSLAQLNLLQQLDSLIQRDLIELTPSAELNPTQLSFSTYQGKTYGMPYSMNFVECWVRKDLFTDPKEQENFEKQYGYPLANFLKQPDWLMFNDVIAFFNRPPDLYGYVHPMVWAQASIPAFHTRWYTCTGKQECDENWNPWFDRMGDNGLLSMELLKYQMKFMPPGVQSMDNPDALAIYLQGKVAVTTGWDSFTLSKFEDPSSSKVVGKTVQTPPIGGPLGWANYSNLGHSLGITPKPTGNQLEATWAVMKVLTSSQNEAYRMLHGGEPPASGYGWEMLSQLEPALSDDTKYVSSYVAHSAGVSYGPFLDALVAAYQKDIAAGIAGQISSDTALKNMANDFRAAYQPYISKNVPNDHNVPIPAWTGPDYTTQLIKQIGM
jgi:ABC-type glycerol-3-phosphate transport system substrate-binding protein